MVLPLTDQTLASMSSKQCTREMLQTMTRKDNRRPVPTCRHQTFAASLLSTTSKPTTKLDPNAEPSKTGDYPIKQLKRKTTKSNKNIRTICFMTIRAHIFRCAKPNKNLAIAPSNPNLAVQDEDVGNLQGCPLFFCLGAPNQYLDGGIRKTVF